MAGQIGVDDALNPFLPRFDADPYPVYERLRDAGPVHRVRIRDGLDVWICGRHHDVRAVLGDPRMSVDPGRADSAVREAIAAGQPEEKLALLGRHLLSTDPPGHTRMRRLMAHALTPTRMARLETPIRLAADGLLDRLAGRGEVDLVTGYAVPLAVAVIAELLGIAAEHRPRFVEWGLALAQEELATDQAFDAVCDEMAPYLLALVEERRRRPVDDLVSALASARDDDRLDDHELLSLCYQVFFAGHETTACTIASAVLLLLTHPDQLARLRREPALLTPAVEEVLRCEGPVKVPTWRFPMEDVRIGGATIRAGEPVLVLLGSASRDPKRFAAADTFDVTRTPNAHVAFGAGLHHCMGAPLGRLEVAVAVQALFSRFPGLRLADSAQRLRWRTNLMMRAVRELPVALRSA